MTISLSSLKAMPSHVRAIHLAGEIACWKGWMKPVGRFYNLTPEGEEIIKQLKAAEPGWLIDIKQMAYRDEPLQNLAILLKECDLMLNRWREKVWPIPKELTIDDWPYDRALGYTQKLYYLPKRFLVRDAIGQANTKGDAEDLVNALKARLFEADYVFYALDFTGIEDFDTPFFIRLQGLIATTLPAEIKWRVIGLNELGQRAKNGAKA